jgi:hypothetical protein
VGHAAWSRGGSVRLRPSHYASNGLNNATLSGTTFKPLDTIKLSSITVENMSPYPLSNVHIRFFLSTDNVIAADDYPLGDYRWGTFGGESSGTYDYTMTIPTIPRGTYYVGALVTIDGYEDDGYTWNNTAHFLTPIFVQGYVPVLDHIQAITRPDRPFKLKFYGTDFLPGMRVFLQNDQFDQEVEWTNTRLKNSGLFVLKGGDALLQMFPEGVPVTLRLVNSDGGETTATFTR